MFSVDEVIAENLPRIERHGWLKRPVSYLLRRLLHEREFQTFAQQHPHLNGLDFVEATLDYFAFSYRVSEREKEHIPVSGRLVIIANHPIGSLDGIALLHLIGRIRPDVKVIANELLMHVTPLHPMLLPVDNLGGNTPRQNLKAIHQHLANEGAVIVFPAGEVSRLRANGVRDTKWNKGFLRIAKRAKAPILPIYIAARNSALFYGSSMLYKPLSTLLLVQEMFNQRANTVKMHVGKPVSYDTYGENGLSNATNVKLFRKQLYRLHKRKPAIFRTEMPVAHPEDRKHLKEALHRHGERLGQTPDGKQIYLYRHQQDTPILRELGRLREIAFRAVGEGSGRKRDLDRFDHDYYHLILWDADELEISGAYRLGLADRILAERGIEGLYSASLFDYGEAMGPVFAQGIELGRSFVQPRYWGRRSLDYLWYGIGAFVARHPQYRYLFGPVSISGALPQAAKELLVYFYKTYFPGEPMAVSRSPYGLPVGVGDALGVQFSGDDYKGDFARLKQVLDNMGVAVPTLYKQYSEVCEPGGVSFLDFGIDRDFKDCIDGLILVDLHRLQEKKRRRYIVPHLPADAAA